MDVMLFFQLLVSRLFIFPWIIDQSLLNSSLSYATFFCHWIHASMKTLCFIKFIMVSKQVSRPASNLRKFHWGTITNWIPHNSWYSYLSSYWFYLESKSSQVWCTQRKCTCRSGECINLFYCELKCFAVFL